MRSRVCVAFGPDRREGTRKVIESFGMPVTKGRVVLVKPNFNVADPTPGSIHPDTQETVIKLVQDGGPKKVSVGDRSGPAKTRDFY